MKPSSSFQNSTKVSASDSSQRLITMKRLSAQFNDESKPIDTFRSISVGDKASLFAALPKGTGRMNQPELKNPPLFTPASRFNGNHGACKTGQKAPFFNNMSKADKGITQSKYCPIDLNRMSAAQLNILSSPISQTDKDYLRKTLDSVIESIMSKPFRESESSIFSPFIQAHLPTYLESLKGRLFKVPNGYESLHAFVDDFSLMTATVEHLKLYGEVVNVTYVDYLTIECRKWLEFLLNRR